MAKNRGSRWVAGLTPTHFKSYKYYSSKVKRIKRYNKKLVREGDRIVLKVERNKNYPST